VQAGANGGSQTTTQPNDLRGHGFESHSLRQSFDWFIAGLSRHYEVGPFLHRYRSQVQWLRAVPDLLDFQLCTQSKKLNSLPSSVRRIIARPLRWLEAGEHCDVIQVGFG
jgi:hypothetical protein